MGLCRQEIFLFDKSGVSHHQRIDGFHKECCDNYIHIWKIQNCLKKKKQQIRHSQDRRQTTDSEKIFTTYILFIIDKELLFRICQDILILKEKDKLPSATTGKGCVHFTKEESQMVNKPIKQCSVFFGQMWRYTLI